MKLHFDFMVIDHIDKQGIWFKSTRKGMCYVFFWNPFRLLKGWLFGGIHIGCFPFHKNHINN